MALNQEAEVLWEEEDYFSFKTMKENRGLSWSPWRVTAMTIVSMTAMQRCPHHHLMICQALATYPEHSISKKL